MAILCPPVRAIARPYAASFLTDSITTKLQVRHSKHLNSGLVGTRVIGVLHFLQFMGCSLYESSRKEQTKNTVNRATRGEA